MGVFDQISDRISRRYGEISALDEFSYHVPEHCDMGHARLEIDCFKKKKEYRKSKINNFRRHKNSLESLKSESDSECHHSTTQEIDLCLATVHYDLGVTGIVENIDEKFYPTPYDNKSELFKSTYEQYCAANEKCNTILSGTKCTTAKVLLYPEEEWAKNAKTVQWTIKLNRWWKRYCTVVESCAGGTQTHSAVARISQNRDGTLTITGRFKRLDTPDFKLHLSARISQSDIQNGYLMTGALQQGDIKRSIGMEITHFAVIPKHLD
ncbi:uncharacterized protein LOC120347569 [Styela clava]